MLKRLLIVSHTPHYRRDGQVVGWGPTVREIDHLAQLFPEIVHVAPLWSDPAPASSLPYTSSSVRLRAVSPAGGRRLVNKLGILARLPQYAATILAELRGADAVHIRCPANISLVALLMMTASFRARPCWVKYAGNWQPAASDAFSYRLQRKLLQNNRHRGVVTINGAWPNQPRYIYTFLNPSLSAAELVRGREASRRKTMSSPLRLLFVGRTERAKGIWRILKIAARLHIQGTAFVLDIVGDGPERETLQEWVQARGLASVVNFHGWLARDTLNPFYAAAHLFLLPSQSEGWPKVLSEAMAYGVVPLASNVSAIPQILAASGTGAALEAGDVDGFVHVISRYTEEPERWKRESDAGLRAAQQFSFASYLTAVQAMFRESWDIPLPAPEPALAWSVNE